ncbi:hypothetical protein MMA231_00959 [Asticcacaulis sp. MM231]|uniref:hypothetical protein n=1 Tax=Asticcacaulis sp. MM231 TaxID=3157666 RepID=UPI0032D5AE06
MKDIFFYVPMFVSLCSLGIAGLTFLRNGKWKDGDEIKTAIGNVDSRLTEVTDVQSQHSDRLARLETEIEHVATQGDINVLRAEIKGVESTLSAKVEGVAAQTKSVDAGVIRIEQLLMSEARK